MRRELQWFLTLLAVAAPALGGCGGDERSAAPGARAHGEPRPETAVVTGSERLPSDLPGRIAFQSDRTDRAKIFVLDHEGVHLRDRLRGILGVLELPACIRPAVRDPYQGFELGDQG